MLGGKTTVHLYIRGNCGNQFFQYAFARCVQKKLGADLVINYSKVIQSNDTMNGSDNLLSDYNTVEYRYEYKNDVGGTVFKVLKAIMLMFHLRPFQNRTYRFFLKCARILPFFGVIFFDSSFYPFHLRKRKNIYINGYFESSEYFKDIDEEICRELTPKKGLLKKNEVLYDSIINTESVCITIKRMDVNNKEIADIYQYEISFFYDAVEYISSQIQNPVFFVFSDDIEWCKKNFIINETVFYETPENPIWEKIRLMSSCKHFIIHNSTFSWWAQHLSKNKNKIVIAPSRWMQRYDQPIDIYEDGWIYITSSGEIVLQHE